VFNKVASQYSVCIFDLLQPTRCTGVSFYELDNNDLRITVLVIFFHCQVMLEGRVPDRGGRPNETRPPPEMPSFKQRTEAPQQQRQGAVDNMM